MKIPQIFNKLFKNYLKSDNVKPRVISMWEHSGWGNSIYFSDWNTRRVTGHLTPTPKEGDILRVKMESGRIARFKFKEVRVMSDPKDQFFATVSVLGYEK